MNLHTPHLLFLGDVQNPLDAKTARGMVDWRPDHCVGQLRLPGCEVDLGLPDLTPAAAYALGCAQPGGGGRATGWAAGARMVGIDARRTPRGALPRERLAPTAG